MCNFTWALKGLSHLGVLIFHKNLCMKCDAWAGTLSWWSCQSPVAHSCSLLNHPNTFHRGMFKLNAKSDADLLLYLPSHFECNDHTVHMLIQWHLLPPVTSTVKSSLLTPVRSSPLFLVAILHGCCTNRSRYVNNGWTFSGQTCIFISMRMNFLSDFLPIIDPHSS